jgi:hypothetical protein
MPTLFLCSRFCVSERGKLSYQRYVYVLDIVYQKEGNCVFPTMCVGYILDVSKRGKLIMHAVC